MRSSQLGGERAVLVAGLPRPSSRRCAMPIFSGPSELRRSNAAALAAARAATVAELGQLRTVRATIRAYVGEAPAVFVDTRRVTRNSGVRPRCCVRFAAPASVVAGRPTCAEPLRCVTNWRRFDHGGAPGV